MSASQLGLVALLAVAASYSQSLSGFGFNLLIVPPLALVIGPKQAVVTATMMGVVTSALTLNSARASVAWKLSGVLFLAAALGMPLGLLVLVALDPDALRLVISLTVLVAAGLYWRGYRLSVGNRLLDVGAGFVSGVLNTSTSMSGPPLVLYLQNRGIEPREFRATINAFFLASGLLASFLFLLGDHISTGELLAFAVAGPVIWLGWSLGNRSFNRLRVETFQNVVLIVLVCSASIAIAGVVLGV